jgi:hypothetical protein
VEPAQPTDKHQLVTFVWRGRQDTRNVLVMINPFTLASAQDYLMMWIPSSDVWYLTICVPHGARFTDRGTDPDHHSKHGQDAPHFVARQRLKRKPQDGQQRHGTPLIVSAPNRGGCAGNGVPLSPATASPVARESPTVRSPEINCVNA